MVVRADDEPRPELDDREGPDRPVVRDLLDRLFDRLLVEVRVRVATTIYTVLSGADTVAASELDPSAESALHDHGNDHRSATGAV